MSKITEQDVISFLQEKLDRLNAEIKKTQAALEAFSENKPEAKKLSAIENIADEPSVKGRRGRKPSVKGSISKPLSVPEEYDNNLRLDKKIGFILKEAENPLNSTEIVARMQELEPDKDAEKLTKAVTVKLSSLYKSGKLTGNKDGRKLRYQL